jgi:hypothetical protein
MITLFLLPCPALVFGHQLLVSRNLLWCENGFHAGDLLFFDLEHLRMIRIANCLHLRFRIVENILQLVYLRRRQLQPRFHFIDIALPVVFRIRQSRVMQAHGERAKYRPAHE